MFRKRSLFLALELIQCVHDILMLYIKKPHSCLGGLSALEDQLYKIITIQPVPMTYPFD